MDKKSKPIIFVGYSEDIKLYQLIDPDTHDHFFHTHVKFDEPLPDPPSSSPSSILPDSHDKSFEIFDKKDIPKVLDPIVVIDPPPLTPPTIISTPLVDVASYSTYHSHMPKWDCSTLEYVAHFI